MEQSDRWSEENHGKGYMYVAEMRMPRKPRKDQVRNQKEEDTKVHAMATLRHPTIKLVRAHQEKITKQHLKENGRYWNMTVKTGPQRSSLKVRMLSQGEGIITLNQNQSPPVKTHVCSYRHTWNASRKNIQLFESEKFYIQSNTTKADAQLHKSRNARRLKHAVITRYIFIYVQAIVRDH